jgi:hyperosmotically inducible periplasmic protein
MQSIYTLKTATLAIVLAFAATGSTVMAFDTDAVQANQAPLAAEFAKLDANNNAVLGRTEAGRDKLFTKSNFAQADFDHDGTLDQNEYTTYKSAVQHKAAHRVVDDSVITTKAKATILATKDLKSLQISVETHKGEVILSGFVDNEAAKMKAEEVVLKIDGVKSVKNSLEVKV